MKGKTSTTTFVTVSRYAFSPERIEVRVGERVWLNVVSVDGAHGFQVKALGLNAGIPADGRTLTFELTPKGSARSRLTAPSIAVAVMSA